MADIEQRVDSLEKEFIQWKLDLNKFMGKIEKDLVEIKACVTNSSSTDDLKNDIIKKDVNSNTNRIMKLEEIVSKICWGIVFAVIGLAGGAIVYYIKVGI